MLHFEDEDGITAIHIRWLVHNTTTCLQRLLNTVFVDDFLMPRYPYHHPQLISVSKVELLGWHWLRPSFPPRTMLLQLKEISGWSVFPGCMLMSSKVQLLQGVTLPHDIITIRLPVAVPVKFWRWIFVHLVRFIFNTGNPNRETWLTQINQFQRMAVDRCQGRSDCDQNVSKGHGQKVDKKTYSVWTTEGNVAFSAYTSLTVILLANP